MEFNIHIWYGESNYYGNRGQYFWKWWVSNNHEVKKGECLTRWGAKRQARRACKRIKKLEDKIKRRKDETFSQESL